MKAIIAKPEQFNASQPQNKETVNTLNVVAFVKGEIKTIITARFYMGRSASSQTVFCCLWVNNICSGRGQAGGWGYHKESAALASAITSAGIELFGTPYKGGKQKIEKYTHYDHDAKTYVTEELKIDYTKLAHIYGCGSVAMENALMDIARDICGAKKVHLVRG